MKKGQSKNSIYHYFCRDPLQRLCMGRGARVAPPSSFLRTALSIKPPHLSTVSVSICASFLFLLCILSKICPIVTASSQHFLVYESFHGCPLLLDSMRNLHFFISILNKSISYISTSSIPPYSSWNLLRSKRKGGWILLYTHSFIHFLLVLSFFFLLLCLNYSHHHAPNFNTTSWSIHWTNICVFTMPEVLF